MTKVLPLVALSLLSLAFSAVPEDKVTNLPYYVGNINFDHYSGYLSTGPKRFHYWLVESQSDPAKDPLLLWLNGGPGCSSMYGFLFENGPFMFCERGASNVNLCENKYSWNKIANVLFIESPVGVGFTYSPFASDYFTNDTQTAIDNYAVLQDFFTKFPEFIGREFYISGESYAGIYIPTLADEIRRANLRGERYINLKGFLVGNGVTEPDSDSIYNSLAPFSFGHGLISQDTMARIEKCNGGATPLDPACVLGLSELSSGLSGVNRYQIYDDCFRNKKIKIPFESLQWDDGVDSDVPCIDTTQASTYFSLKEVHQAIHVEDIDWEICSNTLRYTKNYGSDSFQFYPELVKNYRIIIFSGDTDAAVPHVGSELWTKKLGQTRLRDWHQWRVNGQVAGYAITYQNLEYVTYKGGTHTVPESHPEQSLYMLQKFFNNEPI